MLDSNSAIVAAWDRRRRSRRVRTTPASTTPTFPGTGIPAGFVERVDEIAPGSLEPRVAARQRGLHLVRCSSAQREDAAALRSDLDRESLAGPPAQRAA